MLSSNVEQAVEKAIKEAKERQHEFASIEHLCLVLFDEQKVRILLSHMGVSFLELKKKFLNYLDYQVQSSHNSYKSDTVLSLSLQRVLQRATFHVLSSGKNEVSFEDILVATMDEEESFAAYLLQQAGVTRLDLVSIIANEESFVQENISDSAEDEINLPNRKSCVLSLYTINLTTCAKNNQLDQVIGREIETSRAIQILSRRKKNNPLFVGDEGVGKTALANALAIKIANNDVPDYLKNAELFLLDMASLLAGAKYRGDFENRLKSVIAAVKQHKNAIMVIDEIHMLIGAGASSGTSIDAANLLKPALADGSLRCIGATTFKEYRNYFDKDKALSRRFQKIDISEPSKDVCVQILKGIKSTYEKFHNLLITDSAVLLSVDLSIRFLHEKKLPDKAIDLLDEACALVKLKHSLIVDDYAIQETLALMANIPSSNINFDDKSLLLNLNQRLKKIIFGQDEAIEIITDAIMLSRSGLKDTNKPIANFLFMGPTGVGKTEIAKALADILGVKFIRLDMSEYMERHNVSKLIGAPPGYMGYEKGGILTDLVNQNPYAVVLLDEIEKAHSDVFNMLLQVMDYGKLTDGLGRSSDFRHVILIMTSNIGTKELEENHIGFNTNLLSQSAKVSTNKAVKILFTPEFRNRLDKTITFNYLKPEIILLIVDKFLQELSLKLKEKNIDLHVTEEAKHYLAQEGYFLQMGARPIARIIQEKVKKPLSNEILFGKLQNGGSVHISLVDNNLIFKCL